MSECCLWFWCKSEKHFRSEYEQITARSGKIYHKTEELRTVTNQICVLSLENQHMSTHKTKGDHKRDLDNSWEKKNNKSYVFSQHQTLLEDRFERSFLLLKEAEDKLETATVLFLDRGLTTCSISTPMAPVSTSQCPLFLYFSERLGLSEIMVRSQQDTSKRDTWLNEVSVCLYKTPWELVHAATKMCVHMCFMVVKLL